MDSTWKEEKSRKAKDEMAGQDTKSVWECKQKRKRPRFNCEKCIIHG